MNRIPVSSPASVAVFRRILTHGPLGRIDVSRATGLSQAAVTKAVTPLMESGFVVEAEPDRSSPIVGRPVNPLIVAHNRAHIIGIKITANRTYGVLTDLGANVIGRTDIEHGSADVQVVVDTVADIVSILSAESGITADGLGVAVSGDINRAQGVIRESPLLGWTSVPLGEILQDRVGIPVVVENDVRALTVTELFFGAGRDSESFAVITIGTGVGCGIFANGRIVEGAHGVSGEIGHLPLARESAVCSCGRTGCVEAVASTGSILKRVRDGHDNQDLDLEAAFRLAHDHDPIATAAFEEAGGAIGSALAALVNLVGPELVVITGESVTEYDLYEHRLRDTFAQHAFGAAGACEIVLRPHVFDDWARGAAACVVEHIASGNGA